MSGSDDKKPIPMHADNPALLLGHYSNVATVSYSPFDFTLDFAHMAPGMPMASLKTRVVMSPQHMKAWVEATKENLARYEEMFGEIKIPHDPKIVYEPKTN